MPIRPDPDPAPLCDVAVEVLNEVLVDAEPLVPEGEVDTGVNPSPVSIEKKKRKLERKFKRKLKRTEIPLFPVETESGFGGFVGDAERI